MTCLSFLFTKLLVEHLSDWKWASWCQTVFVNLCHSTSSISACAMASARVLFTFMQVEKIRQSYFFSPLLHFQSVVLRGAAGTQWRPADSTVFRAGTGRLPCSHSRTPNAWDGHSRRNVSRSLVKQHRWLPDKTDTQYYTHTDTHRQTDRQTDTHTQCTDLFMSLVVQRLARSLLTGLKCCWCLLLTSPDKHTHTRAHTYTHAHTKTHRAASQGSTFALIRPAAIFLQMSIHAWMMHMALQDLPHLLHTHTHTKWTYSSQCVSMMLWELSLWRLWPLTCLLSKHM